MAILEMLGGLSHSMSDRHGPLVLLEDTVRCVIWSGIPFLWFRAVRRKWSTIGAGGRWWLACLAGVFVCALAIRLTIPPWAPLHDNEHGTADLRRLSSPPSEWHRDFPKTDFYGTAQAQIVRPIVEFTHTGWRGALAFGAVMGSLAVLFVGLIGAQVTRSRVAGLVAAVGLAFDPSHVQLSLTESPLCLAGTLFVGGIAAFWLIPAQATERHRGELFALGTLSIAAAAEMHVVTLVLPLAAALAAGRWWRSGRTDRRWMFCSLGLALLSVGLHVLYAAPVISDALAHRGGGVREAWRSAIRLEGEITNPMLVSPGLRPLVAIGLGALTLRRQPLVAIAMALACSLTIWVGYGAATEFSDIIRYQTPGHLLLFALAGACAGLFPRGEGRGHAARNAVTVSLRGFIIGVVTGAGMNAFVRAAVALPHWHAWSGSILTAAVIAVAATVARWRPGRLPAPESAFAVVLVLALLGSLCLPLSRSDQLVGYLVAFVLASAWLLFRRGAAPPRDVFTSGLAGTAVAMAVQVHPADVVQDPTAWPSVLLVGSALLLVMRRSPPRAAASALLAALLAVPSWHGLAELRHPRFSQAAFRVVVDSASVLPRKLVVITGPRHREGSPVGDFPEYVLQQSGHEVEVVEQGDQPGSPAPAIPRQTACYVWLGASCFVFDGATPWPPEREAFRWHGTWLRRECADVANEIDETATPIGAMPAVLTQPPDRFVRFSDPPLVGFYPCRPAPPTASPR